MLKDITLGQYFPGDTLAHKLDPRTKLLVTVLYIVALFTAKSYLAYGLLVLTLVVAVRISRVSVKALFKGLKPVLFIIAFTAVLNLFYTPGREIWHFWIFRMTIEGVRAAVTMMLRITLLIMGTFSLVLYNLHVMIVDLEKENAVLVYIDETYSEAEAKSVGSQINLISNVHEAKYISRQQALDSFVEDQNDATSFAGLDASTLRDRYEVTMENSSLTQQTVEEIKKIDGVAEVMAHYEIINGFQTLQKVLNIASSVIIVVLFVLSLFIISNTVKLAMYSRSEEIAIMKMVGATNGFIRLPFVVEGLVLGLVGGLVAFLLQWGLYSLIVSKIMSTMAAGIITVLPFASVALPLLLVFLGVGVLVGVFGGLTAIRNYLKV